MRRFFIFLILFITLTACRGEPASSSPEAVSPTLTASTPQPTSAQSVTEYQVLASTTLLADITQNVAGNRVQIGSVLPVGADPHSYQFSPQDVVKVAEIELLILFDDENYELFLEPLLYAADGNMEFVYSSVGVSKRVDFDMGGFDPHIWLDPNNIIISVENIREGLTHLDPDGAAEFQSNADEYVAELQALAVWIIEQVNQIPAERKLLITNHQALGYFADRYGFTVVGAVLESFSSDASPSAQQMAGLIDQIKTSGAPAIFLDAGDNPAFAQQIADETDVKVITDLHLESLTDGAPAATYIEMMQHNVMQIVNALK